jgi:fructokinase
MPGHIYCIGEALIDFVCTDSSRLRHGKQFEKNAGGAPANVAAAVAKLGGEISFLGQVGKDDFGDHLKDTLVEHGVQTQGMIQKGTTTLAFVGIDQAGERSFSFVQGAAGNYEAANLPKERRKAPCFSYGDIKRAPVYPSKFRKWRSCQTTFTSYWI